MRYKITESINKMSGSPIFYAYENKGGDPEVWILLYGDSNIDACRAYIQRHREAVPDKVVEEFEG